MFVCSKKNNFSPFQVDYEGMNALIDKYGASLAVLAFPCNQFGHQENGDKEEILLSLKHVRPGNGFVSKATIMQKGDVNGEKAQDIFKYLRVHLPYPSDRTLEMDMENPYGVMKASNVCLWAPRSTTDLMWNFEKFLINKNGVPSRRFSRKHLMKNLSVIGETNFFFFCFQQKPQRSVCNLTLMSY